MRFLHTNDLSGVKNGELNLDFKVVIKTGGVVGCKLKINKINCKIELLEALGHSGWNPMVTEGSRVFSSRWGG